jgi:phosphopentomutase
MVPAEGAEMIHRVLILVIDSLGVGELPDAAEYGDLGSHTLKNTAHAVGGLRLPHLENLGLGMMDAIPGLGRPARLTGAFGKMAERSKGKDSTTGHWEMMGVWLREPFPTYPKGFPPEIINAFEIAIGKEVLGNVPASGTVIIKELGAEHMKTGKPIVYTSADSVFQIAAHEEVIPLETLYSFCRTARSILIPPHHVSRVIARPFIGRPGAFVRTEHRRDFSVEPPEPTLLDRLTQENIPVIGVGKIDDLFAGRGIKTAYHTKDNQEGVDLTLKAMKDLTRGLVFTNLVDFDMLFGHRNDPIGYAIALAELDARIPEILTALGEDGLLMITADHGNDPTTPGTDHSREYVPLLVAGRMVRGGVDLGVRSTFADVGQTIAEVFSPTPLAMGQSFLSEVRLS